MSLRWLHVPQVALPKHRLIDGLTMYRTISLVLLAVGLTGATHVAQSPPDDRRLISRQSIKLTAEQEYVIRENIKDLREGRVAQNIEAKVGEKVSPDVEL